jgi:hypothetical protein
MLEIQQAGLILPLLLALTCAIHRPDPTFQLSARDSAAVLIPPDISSAALEQRTLDIRGVRGTSPCPREIVPITIHRSRARFRVTVRPGLLVRQEPGWLADWTAVLEQQGCLAPGTAMEVAVRIAQSVPLDPSHSYRLLYSPAGGEILPQSRIQVVSPILRPGAGPALASADLLGYETSWYTVVPRPDRTGFAIALLSAERTVSGRTGKLAQPSFNPFRFAPEASFYRLLYKQDQTGLAAWIIAGRTRSDLNQRTRSLEEGSGTCEAMAPAWCTAIPQDAAVNVMLPVTVNGAPLFVRWGGTVGEAIRESGVRAPDAVLPQLTVVRMYLGHPVPVAFDKRSPAILNLPLLGHEVISWK